MLQSQENAARETDERIARLLKRRDPAGLQQLLATYGSRVKWCLRKDLGGALTDAELDEAMNSAAFNAWRSARTYDPSRGRLRAWFWVVAWNCAMAILRREAHEKRQRKVPDLDRAAFAPSEPVDPAPSPERQRFIDDLRRCIDALPPLQMSIIKADLRNGDVADAAELAAAFDTSKNSIYASRSIARKTLRRAMIGLGHFDGDGDNGHRAASEQ